MKNNIDFCSQMLPGTLFSLPFIYGPRQANLVLIAYASSEDSGEPEPPLLAHTSSESRGTFKQKTRSLAPLNGWACTVKIYHDRMLENTNSLDGAHIKVGFAFFVLQIYIFSIQMTSLIQEYILFLTPWCHKMKSTEN